VPALCLLYCIHGKKPQCIDGQQIQFAHNNLALFFENTSVSCSKDSILMLSLR
jgi:hypothetical protein